jgi:uncharacterized protein (TIGR02596 family)
MTPHLFPLRSSRPRAFTLVEMLVVMCVIAALLAVTLPSMFGAIKAYRITAAGDQVMSLLSQAQQIAAAEGRPVEVRFYKYASGETLGASFYRSIVLMRYYDAGEPNPDSKDSVKTLTTPITLHMGESVKLPDTVVFTEVEGGSTLLTLPAPGPASGQSYFLTSGGKQPYEFPYPNSEYRSFIFRPDGTSLAATPGEKWFVTLVSDNDEVKVASMADVKNYYCIQVDPVNGQTTSYRP